MSLLDSNRNQKDIKPKKTAKISDLEAKADNTSEEENTHGVKTTLSIDSSTKNKIQAMVLMGDAVNLKIGMEIAMQAYYDSLPKDKRSMFEILYKSLEQRDNNK